MILFNGDPEPLPIETRVKTISTGSFLFIYRREPDTLNNGLNSYTYAEDIVVNLENVLAVASKQTLNVVFVDRTESRKQKLENGDCWHRTRCTFQHIPVYGSTYACSYHETLCTLQPA